MRIAFGAPELVRSTIEGLGRVEDVAFSPSNGLLALAAFERNSIGICEIDIRVVGNRPCVEISNAVELAAPSLNAPHGVCFLDDRTVVVANREGNVAVIRLSAGGDTRGRAEFTPIDLPEGAGFEQLGKPSALTILEDPEDGIEVLVCNNSSDTVTMHELEIDPLSVKRSDVMLHRYLSLPDGVAVDADNQWLAVSSNYGHRVMLYERSRPLEKGSAPDAILLGAHHPHGVCFSIDGRRLFVADGYNPYVLVYDRDGEAWRGVQQPTAAIRVRDDDAYERAVSTHGYWNAGPKGIDLDRGGNVLAVTFVTEPVAFFDARAILERCTEQCPDHALRLAIELQNAESQHARMAARIETLEQSASFRITKPLRALNSARRRISGR
jgi:DNA-binding beta-propeller fold protein YncE